MSGTRLPSSTVSLEDLRLIAYAARANVLLLGPEMATSDALVALKEMEGLLYRPLLSWPTDGAPWRSDELPGTLVLEDVSLLSPSDQEQLLVWLRQAGGRRPQVISRSSEPVYPLVMQRRFLIDLYYTLNMLAVDCDASL